MIERFRSRQIQGGFRDGDRRTGSLRRGTIGNSMNGRKRQTSLPLHAPVQPQRLPRNTLKQRHHRIR